MKQPLHFVHGNGFPSSCYRQLLLPLAQEFTCFAIDKVGHTSFYPVTDNWEFLVHEVIESIEKQVDGPVIGLGHSLGGVLTMLAAIERPELFKAVIMLDSPLLGWFKSRILEACKRIGLVDRVTPAFKTRGRRTHWTTREQVEAYLQARPLFKSFTPACLHDYMEHGLEKTKSGYVLRFDRSIECEIYRTIPHVLWRETRQLSCPSALIYGNASNLIRKSDIRFMRKKYHLKCIATPGGHMFPFEYPHESAALVIECISQFMTLSQKEGSAL